MKKLLASVGVLAFAANAGAQVGNTELFQSVADYTDGTNEVNYKVASPSGASDWWNSFKATDLNGVALAALMADFAETGGFDGTHAEIGIYPDLGAGVPDINNPVVNVLNPAVPAGDATNADSAYSIPLTTISGSGSYHVAATYATGDSHCWMCTDTTTVLGRTFFTATGYAAGANPFTLEVDLYAGAPNSGAPGTLLINGGSSATVTNQDTVCMEFFGPATSTRFILYFCVGGNPFLQLLPIGVTTTDNVFGGPLPGSWQLCQPLNCNTPTGSNLEFCTIYADKVNTKPNGKASLQLGTSAFLTITSDSTCPSQGSQCFGQKDDCIVDGNVWKVRNPAGASDWFNVNHGVPSSGVTSLTSAGISSYDFCSIGPCWAEVGIYPSNLSLDPTGTTPDVSTPLSNVVGASACMPVAASGGSCPLQAYDGPDYTVDSAAAGGVHVAAQWPTGDSCIWMGSDTDGLDSSCAIPLPSNGTHSLFTGNNYASPAAQFTAANWIMQINWN